MSKNEQLKDGEIRVKPDDVYLSPFAIRKVDENVSRVENLKENIAAIGVHTSIIVRPLDKNKYPDRPEKWELVAGNHRVWCCKKILEEEPDNPNVQFIRASVRSDMSDEEYIKIQTSENTHRIPMSKKQKMEAAQRLMSANPDMTAKQIAEAWNESRATVDNILNLNNLAPELKEIVDTDGIPVSILYAMGRHLKDFPDKQLSIMQEKFDDGSGNLKHLYDLKQKQALDIIVERGKELKKMAKGQVPEFEPKPRFIGANDVLKKAETAQSAGQTDYAEGLLAAISMDTESIEVQKAKWREKKKAAEEAAAAEKAKQEARKKVSEMNV